MDDEIDVKELTPEEYKLYIAQQTLIVLLDNLFCIIFVLCVTFLSWHFNKWALMWFYLLPVMAFIVV